MRNVTYAQALSAALEEAAIEDPRVVFLGEGLVDPQPVFGTMTAARAAAPDRVFEMPTAENAIVGVAAGMAMAGFRPVVAFHRVEFSLLAMEQIINVVAKMRWMSLGRYGVPILIRLIVGRGWGQGAVHAQSLETMFAQVPGLRVVMPSNPHDAYNMTRAALRGGDPVISIENRWCYGLTGSIRPESDPFDGPRLPSMRGMPTKLTIAATSFMVAEAIRAAEALAYSGFYVDVVDIRQIAPLQIAPIIESLRHTLALLFVEAAPVAYGVGAEVCARVARDERKFTVRRLGTPAAPTPSSRFMLPGFYPDARAIFEAALRMRSYDSVGVAEALAQVPAGFFDNPIDQPPSGTLGGSF